VKIRVIRMTADDDVVWVGLLRVDTVGLERFSTHAVHLTWGEKVGEAIIIPSFGKSMNNRIRRRHLLPANEVVLTHRKRPIDTAFMTSSRDR